MTRELLTGVVIARNEERDLPPCLRAWQEICPRIIVVNDGSTDDTPRIARDYGCQVITVEMDPHTGYAAIRNRGLETVETPLALVFDADEIPTVDLLSAIKTIPPSNEIAYRFMRRSNIFGKWVDNGRFGGDSQVRLFPNTTRYAGLVHEVPQLAAGTEIITLPGFIEHFTYRSIGEYIAKMRRYAVLHAANGGEMPSLTTALRAPAHSFMSKHGWRDGWRGAAMALGDGWYYSMVRKHMSQTRT